MRLLLPWEKISNSHSIVRREFGLEPWKSSVYLYGVLPFLYELEVWGGNQRGFIHRIWAPTKCYAMRKADAILVERGFTLVSHERAEKFGLLL